MRNTLHDQLERARRELLDLTARNRLINVPRHRQRGRYVEIVDELSNELFRLFVKERRRMGFLPAEESEVDTADEPDLGDSEGLAPPEDDDLDERGIAARHRDNWLQTAFKPETLQKQLLRIHYDARTTYEEQGVNILYLALGMLEWYESPSSDQQRFAPLLLIPVDLERGSALQQFRLTWTEEDISSNLSLFEKLNTEFHLKIPEVPDIEDLVPSAYFESVRSIVSNQPRFAVHDDHMVLGFFSFAKLRMYHDLDPASWPSEGNILDHSLIGALLTEGFSVESFDLGDDDFVDDWLSLSNTFHVLDADSSQTVAIEEVRQGRNLVIQGPPGTGKSQTICNLIAAAVAEGRKVLFVAEKMAALDVVKLRLETIGLGNLCLELHGRKSNKRALLEELQRTLAALEPTDIEKSDLESRLTRERSLLNAHTKRLHEPIEPSGLSPYRIMGHLVRLREKGVDPADFTIGDAVQWRSDEFQERRGSIRDLAQRIEGIGQPSEHPWRGVGVDALLPGDVHRLSGQITTIHESVGRLRELIHELRAAFQLEDHTVTVRDMTELIAVGRILSAGPTDIDTGALRDPVWNEQRAAISELVSTFRSLATSHDKLEDIVVDAAWSSEIADARRALAAYGRSMFRLLNSDYRRGVASLRGLLKSQPPKSLGEKLEILDTLVTGQRAAKAIDADDRLGIAAFGRLWRGARTDKNVLAAIDQWDRAALDAGTPIWFREAAEGIGRSQDLAGLVDATEEARDTVLSAWRTLCNELKLDVQQAFEVSAIDDVTLDALSDRLTVWQTQSSDVMNWIQYRIRTENAIAVGLAPVVDRLYDGRLNHVVAVDAFEMAYYEVLMRQAFADRPDLAAFDGLEQQGVVASFAEDDVSWIELNRSRIVNRHIKALPHGSDDVGQLGVLRHEFQKKRKHLPIRKLMRRGGLAIQAIKPVFMMSPLSIAQFLEPGGLTFDLLVMDEASQIQPVDALGAVARSRQIVVVGDDKQLPPTRFFSKLVTDDGDLDEEDLDLVPTGDIESILGLCAAQGMQDRMLRWHYRSRHPSLIAVSNHSFYDDRLYVVPSPYSDHPGLGLKFHLLSDGVYDRGGSRTNRVEAAAVADAVIAHEKHHSELSLGVGCFSTQQRDAILDELEMRWRSMPEVKDFFAPGGAEPFFVKNLENIQGDERDVIFVSVGYARNQSGYMAMTFGPVSTEGGERRLNVLMTRARQRCEVFSSITADDIDLARGKGRGVAALKTFLHYAATGHLGIATPPRSDFDSPFEEEVARALEKLGHEVHGQIGVAGFFVDLAIVDPDRPGRYLLGIECDGAAYHSARSARDRDRLRQQVLEDQGWLIHRIWSTDWFRNPTDELRKTEGAIERARAAWSARDEALADAEYPTSADAQSEPDEEGPSSPEPEDIPRPDDRSPEIQAGGSRNSDHGAVGQMDLSDVAIDEIVHQPYREASINVPRNAEPHTILSSKMAEIVIRLVEVEGPVHEDEIARRVASLWGYGRTGKRIVAAVKKGISNAIRRGEMVREGKFCRLGRGGPPTVRDRSNVGSPTVRRPEMLPPSEIRTSLLHVAASNFTVRRDEMITLVGRPLGFKAVSGQLRLLIVGQLDHLLGAGRLKNTGEDIQPV